MHTTETDDNKAEGEERPNVTSLPGRASAPAHSTGCMNICNQKAIRQTQHPKTDNATTRNGPFDNAERPVSQPKAARFRRPQALCLNALTATLLRCTARHATLNITMLSQNRQITHLRLPPSPRVPCAPTTPKAQEKRHLRHGADAFFLIKPLLSDADLAGAKRCVAPRHLYHDHARRAYGKA